MSLFGGSPAKGGHGAFDGKKFFIIATILLLSAACNKQAAPVSVGQNQTPSANNQTATTTPNQATTTTISLPIKYNNTQYGFIFSLPEDWKGYSIYTKQWDGCPLDGRDCSQPIHGPQIYIRNPNWTAQNPYEDIPIMVFTLGEWNQVEQEKISVSAAPIGPSEYGRNKKYVFALPPRYNYDFQTGYEEVDTIVRNHPLSAY